MTRINLVDPKVLTDQHLMAEYRELPMIAASLNRSLKSKMRLNNSPLLKDIPRNYILGTGHVRFFYNKGLFLYKRYGLLIEELKKRNFNLNEDRSANFEIFKNHNLYNDWIPNDDDKSLNARRIVQKLEMKPDWYRFLGVRLTELNDNNVLNQIMLMEYL